MAAYLALAFERNGAAEHPEKLYREPVLMASVIACSIAMSLLLFVNIPALHNIFTPTVAR
jgi:hypothetical protein